MVPSNSPDAALSGPALTQAVEAALAWWRDAGVDGDWIDTPQDWLAKVQPGAAQKTGKPKLPEPEPVRALAGGRDQWPADLSNFADWWLTHEELAPAGARRIAPAGPQDPPLMVVVPMPEADDRETLLSGPAGRLLDGFLGAASLSRAHVYCAAALPARITAPDWAALAAGGLGDVLLHHIGLVRPARLILFGQTGISTLLGNALPNSPTNLQLINHGGASEAMPEVPAMGAYDLEAIVARPTLKAGLWSRWLDWVPA